MRFGLIGDFERRNELHSLLRNVTTTSRAALLRDVIIVSKCRTLRDRDYEDDATGEKERTNKRRSARASRRANAFNSRSYLLESRAGKKMREKRETSLSRRERPDAKRMPLARDGGGEGKPS